MKSLQFGVIALFAASAAVPTFAQTEAPVVELPSEKPVEKPVEKPAEVAPLNGLTSAEEADGWVMLWDGKTTEGWRSAKSDEFPKNGWVMKEGILSTVENGGKESAGGGDIITLKEFSDFELELDFRLSPGANSGIKLFVQPGLSPISTAGEKAAVGSAIGLEFQILDDARHPDARLGKDGNRTLGSLYDLIPAPRNKKANPPNAWNHVRIVSQDGHVEFFLNGVKTVEFDRNSDEFRKRVAASKYSNIPQFGEWTNGHILLQEHGNVVSFCNIKIKTL